MVLCDEPKHVQPGDRGGILQALALGVVELPRDGEDLGEGTKNWQCKKLDKTVTLVQGSSTVLSFFLRSYLFSITPQKTGGLISTSRSRAPY